MSAQARHPHLLTVKQAAISLGVSLNTVRNWDKLGLISSIRTKGGQRRFAYSQLASFLKEKDEKFAAVAVKKAETEIPDLEIKRIIPPPFPKHFYEAKTYQNNIIFSKKVYLPSAFLSLIVAAGFFSHFLNTPIKSIIADQLKFGNFNPPKSVREESGSVLAVTNQRSKISGNVSFNVPAIFKDNVKLLDKDLSIGSGRLTASNVIYSLQASDGISVTSDQNPTIKNTGVLSLNSKTGALTLEAGSNITISGLKISASTPSINSFSKIKFGSDTASAGSDDTFTFAGGTGISLSLNTTDKKLTVSASSSDLNVSGWTDGGTTVSLTTSSDTVNIGSLTASRVVFTDSSKNLTSSGTVDLSQGGLGIASSSISKGDIFYAATDTPTSLTRLAIGATGRVLQVNSSSLPAWAQGSGGSGQGSVCTDCLINDPTDNSINVVSPTGVYTTALSLKQTSTSNSSADVFNVTNNAGTTKYFQVDSNGNIGIGTSATTGTAKFAILSGNIGIGTTSPNSFIQISPSSFSGTPSTSGSILTITSSTLTDNSTAASAALSSAAFTAFAAPTLDASNSSIKTFHAATVYIANGPTSTTNNTIINSYPLQIASGTSAFGGNIAFTSSSNAILGTAVEGLWTLGSNTFTYRRPVTITNNDDSQSLPANYEITNTITGSTASQILNNSRADLGDFRIADSSSTELAMNVSSSPSTPSITLSFQLSSSVSHNSTSTYYLYYSAPSYSTSRSTYTAANETVDSGDSGTVGTWSNSEGSNYTIAAATISPASALTSGTQDIDLHIATSMSGTANTNTFADSGRSLPNSATGSVPTATLTQSGTTYVYFVGGAVGTTIYSATVATDGTLSTSYTSAGTLPSGVTTLTSHKVAIATFGSTSYMYIVGGVENDTNSNKVYRAQINSNGTIGTFSQVQTLSGNRFGHGLVILTISGTTYMYVIGGQSASSTYVDTVLRSTISASSTGTFSTVQTLPEVRATPAVGTVISGTGYLYVVGGPDTNTAQTTVYRSTVDSSGTPSTFTSATAALPAGRVNTHALFLATISGNTYIYLSGGTSTSGADTIVWKGNVDSSGDVTSWTQSTTMAQMTTQRRSHSMLVVTPGPTSFLFAIGGVNNAGTSLSTIETSRIREYVAIKTLTSTLDLSSKQGLQFALQTSSACSSCAYFEFSQDGITWQSTALSAAVAGTWYPIQYDTNSIPSSSKNTIKYLRFRLAAGTTPTDLYFDNIQALVTFFTGSLPSTSVGNPTLGANNLAVNSQGTGTVSINYDATNSLAGTGGLTVYNGASTPLFTVSGSTGNVGIGFSSPQRPLMVASDINITSSNASLLGANGTQFALTGSSGSGGTEKKLVLGIDTTDNYGVIQAGNLSGTNYNLSLNPAGGNVGIGTSSPTSLFHIQSSSSSLPVMLVTSSANVGIGTSVTSNPLTVGTSGTNGNGAYLSAGGIWTNGSSFEFKENFTLLDSQKILAKINLLPVSQWNYILEGSEIKHIGPIAEDFYSIFGLGNDNKHISTIDPSGIALVGIQALSGKVDSLAMSLSSLQEKIASLSAVIASPSSTLQAENATSSATLNLTSPDILLATPSAALKSLTYSDATFSGKLTASEGIFSDSLKSFGKTALANTLIAGDLTVDGTLSLTGKSISTPGILYLQNEPLSEKLDIFNGKLQVRKDGKLTVSKLEISSETIGQAILPAGKTEVTIENKQVSETSKIFLTAVSPTSKQVLFVSSQQTETGFTVAIEAAITSDIKFNWWIVDERKI